MTRHLPVVYEERSPISLFKAQHSDSESDKPTKISDEVIVDVVNTLNRFKQIAQSYQINQSNVKLTATEATRTAPNKDDFIKKIFDSTKWEIETLEKDREAKISAKGVVATYYGVEGLVMDMGGGSVEFNYVIHRPHEAKQEIPMSEKPINLPYGAAVLASRLEKLGTPKEREGLFTEIVKSLEEGFKNLNAPDNLKGEDGSFNIYMNGGGFKSLGYLSMSETEFTDKHTNQKSGYPIPIINGYCTSAEELLKIAKRIAPSHDANDDEPSEVKDPFPNGNPFRVSKRRAKLLPASAFLFEAIMEVLKARYVYFCEGGVRHGYCFDILSTSEQSVDPLESFIKSHPLQPKNLKVAHHEQLLQNIKKAIPPVAYEILDSDITLCNKPKRLERLLPNLIYLAYWSMNFGKEARPITAFQLSLAGGPLANAPGLTHTDRAIIAWCLMYRYHEDGSGSKSGGVERDVSMMAPIIFDSVKKLIPGGKDGRKICEIVGKLIGFAILCYPVDVICTNALLGLNIFESYEEEEDDYAEVTQIKKTKKKHTILLILSEGSDSSQSSFVNNSIVKGASEKLEKKYTLGGNEKEGKKHEANITEIHIQIKRIIALKETRIQS